MLGRAGVNLVIDGEMKAEKLHDIFEIILLVIAPIVIGSLSVKIVMVDYP